VTTALRPARLDDCERVWQWNFAAETRAMSRDPRIVELAAHAAWYTRRIAEPDAPVWIVEEDATPVGVVRLDRADAVARISIAIAAEARGRGIGKRAITAACTAWHAPVVAEVLDHNTPSRACFEACGFVETARTDAVITYRWSP
jgi:RimJ/RimL family protein N-acetyltransferase